MAYWNWFVKSFNKFQSFNQFCSQGRHIPCTFGSCVNGTRELVVEGLLAKGIMS